MKLRFDYGGRDYVVQINRAWSDGFGAEDIEFELLESGKRVIIDKSFKEEIGAYVRQLLGIGHEEQD